MLRPVTAAALTGAVIFNLCCLHLMNSMFVRRKAILVRARSPVLAYLQGLAMLVVADTIIVDELLKLEGSQLPCFVVAYSIFLFLPLASNMLFLRLVTVALCKCNIYMCSRVLATSMANAPLQ
jgi:hypothetical protein